MFSFLKRKKKSPAPKARPTKVAAKKTAKATPKTKAKTKPKKAAKPIGKVVHFYRKISVAIVKFNKKVPAGITLRFRGGEADFEQVATSMQYNHKTVAAAPKGKQIGIKVKKRVHEGVLVYEAE